MMTSVVRVPPDLAPEDADLFERCVGHEFEVIGRNEIGWLELEVGAVLGKAPVLHSIWIEPEFVK